MNILVVVSSKTDWWNKSYSLLKIFGIFNNKFQKSADMNHAWHAYILQPSQYSCELEKQIQELQKPINLTIELRKKRYFYLQKEYHERAKEFKTACSVFLY